jgi:hypothetical protein
MEILQEHILKSKEKMWSHTLLEIQHILCISKFKNYLQQNEQVAMIKMLMINL